MQQKTVVMCVQIIL